MVAACLVTDCAAVYDTPHRCKCCACDCLSAVNCSCSHSWAAPTAHHTEQLLYEAELKTTYHTSEPPLAGTKGCLFEARGGWTAGSSALRMGQIGCSTDPCEPRETMSSWFHHPRGWLTTIGEADQSSLPDILTSLVGCHAPWLAILTSLVGSASPMVDSTHQPGRPAMSHGSRYNDIYQPGRPCTLHG